MFLRFPVVFDPSVIQTILVLNTVILIVALITIELLLSGMPEKKRKTLKFIYPLLASCALLLLFAVYRTVVPA